MKKLIEKLEEELKREQKREKTAEREFEEVKTNGRKQMLWTHYMSQSGVVNGLHMAIDIVRRYKE